MTELKAASDRSLAEIQRNSSSAFIKSSLTVSSVSMGDVPAEYDGFFDVYFINAEALEVLRKAGWNKPVFTTIPVAQLPIAAGRVCHLPIYMHADQSAIRPVPAV